LAAVAAISLGLLTAGAAPQVVAPANATYVHYTAGNIHVPVPEVQQPDNYSCGAASTMAILAYYGVGPEDYGVLKKKLGTTKKNGTDYERIVKYVNGLTAATGLSAAAHKGMTPDQLDALLKAGHPVICSIQAYDEDTPAAQRAAVYKEKNDNGHFVVAIGCDEQNFYFMDPSLTGRRGFLRREEFADRWHDNEGTDEHPNVIHHLGLVFSKQNPSPVYAEVARRIE
jgi:predicted double-glycine peptidase